MEPESRSAPDWLDPPPPRWRASIGVLLVALVVVLLFPFDFHPVNQVARVLREQGIYFEGRGLATAERVVDDPRQPLAGLTAELWLHMPLTAKNWGERIILSLCSTHTDLPMSLGIWGGRLFLYHPFGPVADPWHAQFMLKPTISRAQDHFVAFSIGNGLKSIHIDGQLIEERRLEGLEEAPLQCPGPLTLANTPSIRGGWWGLARGIAIFDRPLTASEIALHYELTKVEGVGRLKGSDGLAALYPLTEMEGDRFANWVPGGPPLVMPRRLRAPLDSLLNLNDLPRKLAHPNYQDLIQNVLLFAPMGWLLGLRIRARTAFERFVWVFILAGVGAALSAAFETAQLFLPNRASSLSDVLANGVGTGLGAVASRFGAKHRRTPTTASTRGLEP